MKGFIGFAIGHFFDWIYILVEAFRWACMRVFGGYEDQSLLEKAVYEIGLWLSIVPNKIGIAMIRWSVQQGIKRKERIDNG